MSLTRFDITNISFQVNYKMFQRSLAMIPFLEGTFYSLLNHLLSLHTSLLLLFFLLLLLLLLLLLYLFLYFFTSFTSYTSLLLYFFYFFTSLLLYFNTSFTSFTSPSLSYRISLIFRISIMCPMFPSPA